MNKRNSLTDGAVGTADRLLTDISNIDKDWERQKRFAANSKLVAQIFGFLPEESEEMPEAYYRNAPNVCPPVDPLTKEEAYLTVHKGVIIHAKSSIPEGESPASQRVKEDQDVLFGPPGVREANIKLFLERYGFDNGMDKDSRTETLIPEDVYRHAPNVCSRKPRIRIIHRPSLSPTCYTDQYHYLGGIPSGIVTRVGSYEQAKEVWSATLLNGEWIYDKLA